MVVVKLTRQFMMDDALEEEDYGFEYEDDDDEHEGDADVENKYYNATVSYTHLTLPTTPYV